MGPLKPDDFISQALTAFFLDVGNQYQVARRDLDRNLSYLLKRYEQEGLGFVTKTLPQFGKAFDLALQTGKLPVSNAFKKRTGTPLPLFLTGLASRVFAADGTLLDSPDIDAIRFIRQLCYQFYKLELDYPKEITDECIKGFVNLDSELVHVDKVSPEIASVLYEASRVVDLIFKGFDARDISPRPGPGQSSERAPAYMRYEPHVLYSKVHAVYPYYSYYYINSRHLCDSVRKYRALPRHTEGVSRLALVPKDSRGPRIICMEPTEYMWLQQGLGRAIMQHLERHWLTAGHVNFTDQTINQKLALHAVDRQLATLDMKDASDRISKNLIDVLFHGVPVLKDRLLALSTNYTELPDGTRVRTNKFAPMGSALCFPVMSVVHFALGMSVLRHRYPGRSLKALAKDFFVYGDDLIVHVNDVQDFFDTFPVYGLKFNPDKSCYRGKFRESCGVDAYDGVDVTPQRVRVHTISRKQWRDLPRHVAIANNFRKKGYMHMHMLWKRHVEQEFGELPYVSAESCAIGWIVPRSRVRLDNLSKLTWNRNLQSWGLRTRVVKAPAFCSMMGGWEQLMRAQLHTQEDSTSFVRRRQIKISWRWVPISSL